MKIQVITNKHSGNPKDIPTCIKSHLVDSTYISEYSERIEIIINTSNDLSYTGSNTDGICYGFIEDDPWQGWITTEVTIIAENEDELVKLKGNQFRQYERGQYVFLIVPWTYCDDEHEVISWENV